MSQFVGLHTEQGVTVRHLKSPSARAAFLIGVGLLASAVLTASLLAVTRSLSANLVPTVTVFTSVAKPESGRYYDWTFLGRAGCAVSSIRPGPGLYRGTPTVVGTTCALVATARNNNSEVTVSSKRETLVDPATGVKEQMWKGFSWPCLFLGPIWFLFKRMWAWTAIALILATITAGVSWLLFPFFANSAHRESRTKDGWRREFDAPTLGAGASDLIRCPECRELVRYDARICKHCRSALRVAAGVA